MTTPSAFFLNVFLPFFHFVQLSLAIRVSFSDTTLKQCNILHCSKPKPQDESDMHTPHKKQQPGKPSQRTPAAIANNSNNNNSKGFGYAAKPVLGTPSSAASKAAAAATSSPAAGSGATAVTVAVARDMNEAVSPNAQAVSPMLISPSGKQAALPMPHQAVEDIADVEKIFKLGRKLGDGNFAVVKVRGGMKEFIFSF